MLEVQAVSIIEADKIFEERTGHQAIRCPWIGCQIIFVGKEHGSTNSSNSSE
jgi:hypothetical protein